MARISPATLEKRLAKLEQHLAIIETPFLREMREQHELTLASNPEYARLYDQCCELAAQSDPALPWPDQIMSQPGGVELVRDITAALA